MSFIIDYINNKKTLNDSEKEIIKNMLNNTSINASDNELIELFDKLIERSLRGKL
ncbi:hypothetical protein [Methanohalophilus sp. RSK]|uniref:hypothetical protein n=1 Tax=Methanohalophilus sp. RSK TaxID=2485783 RepID=UPI00131474D3|nr:hypothetical protein [Methanohalophilus sp. RSK]